MPSDDVTKKVPAEAEPRQREQRDAWLEAQTKEGLIRYARMGSCLCDAAGICAACKFAEADSYLRWAARLLHECRPMMTPEDEPECQRVDEVKRFLEEVEPLTGRVHRAETVKL